jgi:hypothetical protein
VTDTKIYVASIFRILNAYVFPFNFKRWTEDALKVIEDYQSVGRGFFDLDPALEEIRRLRHTLSQFYSELEKAYFKGEKQVERFKQINECLLELGRILIPIDYTRSGKYSHDPAVPIPSFPDLEAVRQATRFSPSENEFRFLKVQVQRGRNKVVDALRHARKEVERCQEELQK